MNIIKAPLTNRKLKLIASVSALLVQKSPALFEYGIVLPLQYQICDTKSFKPVKYRILYLYIFYGGVQACPCQWFRTIFMMLYKFLKFLNPEEVCAVLFLIVIQFRAPGSTLDPLNLCSSQGVL